MSPLLFLNIIITIIIINNINITHVYNVNILRRLYPNDANPRLIKTELLITGILGLICPFCDCPTSTGKKNNDLPYISNSNTTYYFTLKH